MNFYNIIHILGESTLSLYPFVIKLFPLSISLHTFIRLLTYLIISLLFTDYSIIKSIGFINLLLISFVNIIHISSSYYGFKYLNPSLAQSFFYIYPFINLLLGIIILNESIPIRKFIYLIPITISLYYLYNEKDKSGKQNLNLGIPLILIAALTESIIYILLKKTNIISNPWNSLGVIYGLSAIIYSTYYLIFKKKELKKYIETKPNELLKVTFINIFIGLFGYILRFFIIPFVSSISYSVFSYSGIIVNLFLSYLLLSEQITIIKFISILGLVFSLIFMKIT